MKDKAIDEAAVKKEVIENRWAEFFTQGMQYRSTAEKSLKRPEIFKPDIIYNVAAMAIEKILLAVFSKHGQLPYSNTLSAMAAEAKEILAFDETLVSDMERMDRMQMICHEESVFCEDMKVTDVPFFLDVMKRVFDKSEAYINQAGLL